MKYTLFIATLVYFILLNTIQLWDKYLGMFLAYVVFPILMIYSFALLFILIIQLIIFTKEKFSNKSRLIQIIFIIITLTLAYFYPRGLIPYDSFTGDDVLVATNDGTVCGSTIKLKKDNTFIEREICFGAWEHKGRYNIIGDTIYFNITYDTRSDGFYKFGVIKKTNNTNHLILFENQADTIGLYYFVSNNEIKSIE